MIRLEITILVAVLAGLLVCAVDTSKLAHSRTNLDGLMQEYVWCGDENEVVLIRTESNSVYRSDDRGVTFKRITKHMQKVAEEIVEESGEIGDVTNIIKSEADGKTLVFVGNKGVFWVSTNCGATMKALSKNFLMAQVRMHPSQASWLLATSIQSCENSEDEACLRGAHTMYVTQNLGESWKQIATNVRHFEWSFNGNQIIQSSVPEARIYATIKEPKQTVFYRTDDFFGNRTTLVTGCIDFKLRATFLFAVQTIKGEEVALLVSRSEDGFNKFYKAQFPSITLKMRNIHVLDTSESAVFALVAHRSDLPYGNLYVSDSTGVRFQLSLKYCIRHAARGADFHKVQGLEGIYLASVLDTQAAKEFEQMSEQQETEEEEWDDEEKADAKGQSRERQKMQADLIRKATRTAITFNKGGRWRYLTAPKTDVRGKAIHCQGDDDCALNLFLYKDTTVPIYSQANAHGIILATGNVGKFRDPQLFARSVYLSRDGGLNWAEIAQGPHVYDMADHGGLILMARLYQSRTHKAKILYTWNEGNSWEKMTLGVQNATVEDIFTEPDSSTQHFLVHADEFTKDLEQGTTTQYTSIFNLNFEQLHQRACKDNDFETWTPYDGRHGQSCLLGHKISYSRRKQGAECYNGLKYESQLDYENCQCTEEDFECDFGFARKDVNSNSPCLPFINVSYAPPTSCPSGSTYTVSNGYRKVAGDTCHGGVAHDPIVIPCPSTSLMAGSGIIILILLAVIVVLLFAMGYTYQNFDEIRQKLQTTFKGGKSGRAKDRPFKDVKYGKIEEKQEEPEEELVIQASASPEAAQPEKRSGELVEVPAKK